MIRTAASSTDPNPCTVRSEDHHVTSLSISALTTMPNRRITLMVLSGTALIADAVLTRDTGSKVDDGRVPYRSTPPLLLSAWIGTRHGRVQAAAVLVAFNPAAAGGTGDGRGVNADYTYLRLDANGATVPNGKTRAILTECDLFEQADPKRAAEGRQERRARQAPASFSRQERNNGLRDDLVGSIGAALTAVKHLAAEAEDFPQRLKNHPMGRRSQWEKVRDDAQSLVNALYDVRPPDDFAIESGSAPMTRTMSPGMAPNPDSGAGRSRILFVVGPRRAVHITPHPTGCRKRASNGGEQRNGYQPAQTTRAGRILARAPTSAAYLDD